jgi:hypothetical protein
MYLHGLFAVRSFLLSLVLLVAVAGGASRLLPLLDSTSVTGSHNRTPAPEQAQSAASFIDSIGVNAHLSYQDTTYGDFARVQHEVRSVGIRHIREGVHLGSSDDNHLLFGRWIELGKMNIRFDAVLDPRENLGAITPALISRIEQLAGGTIESFEGPNELDINMPDWIAVDREFQKSIFSSVESASASTHPLVIAPSLAFIAKGKDFDGTLVGFDQGNLHPYPGGKMPSVIFPEQPRLAREVFGDKPIVITESGYHNATKDFSDQPGVSEQAAAKYIPRLFLENFSRNIPKTYLYELFDEAPDPSLRKNQLHWGLVRADGTEKPACVALRNLIEELNDNAAPKAPLDLSWTLSDSGPAIHHLLLKNSNGSFYLVLWQEISSYNTWMHHDIDNPAVKTTLLLGKAARRLVLYDPVTQSAPIQAYENVNRVPLSIFDRPLVIRIDSVE